MLGIILVNPPRIENNKLYISEVGVKTSYYDDNDEWYEPATLTPNYLSYESVKGAVEGVISGG